MTNTVLPAKGCCTWSGSWRTHNTSTALLLQLKATKNYFHTPPPRLFKLLGFRLRHTKRPKRSILLDSALVMVTSLHRTVLGDGRQVTRTTWQSLRGWRSAFSHLFTVTASSHSTVWRGLSPAFPPQKALYRLLQPCQHNCITVLPCLKFFEVWCVHRWRKGHYT